MPVKALSHHQKRMQAGKLARVPDFRRSARARGYDRLHERMRQTELADNPQCTFCDRPASIIDHRTPISQGGSVHDPANRRPVCRDCHAKLTANLKVYGINEIEVPYNAKPLSATNHAKIADATIWQG